MASCCPEENRDTGTITQACMAGLLPAEERDGLLEVCTIGEVAQVARQRLLRTGVALWWPWRPFEGPLDPWEAAGRMGLTVIQLPIGGRGRYYHRLGVIVLREGLTAEQEHLTMWHEVIHAERGHDGPVSAEEHADVDRVARVRAMGDAQLSYAALAGDRG